MIKEGERAPAVTIKTVRGDEIRADRPGMPLVVYFYPRDDTPGCTTEAKDFTEHLASFEEAGVRVVGVSRDSEEKHRRFIDKHDLSVPLASDEKGKISDAFGTWDLKKFMGREFMGMIRSTFLIDREGKVVRAWPKVRVKGHVEEVLEAARSL
ncbi:peroxiredoxin [Sphingomicrobium lutaoense]|uniref:thioredoxin-dependent peroxiredoxin n=1 Tax=Sphingomicrobium lutaoense TaxID=515949 RepID=A0A839Z0X4_9SPHN|nr:peroxiredoxin [Sphingomicrobium lutaoense]MBB3764330.1 peroxiredoxin Q/BCP [Sphingomicrobium lutaoense]